MFLNLSRCCLLGLLMGSLWRLPVQAADLADTVDKMRASIVAVGTVQPAGRPPAKFHATGFVVGEGRQVVTNAHALPDFLDAPNKETLAVFIGRGQQFQSRPAKKIATDSDRKLLKEVSLFDVYEGKNLPAGQKSYAVSFFLQDEEKTLNDKQIDAIMKKIQTNLEQKLGAQLR